MLDTIMGLAVSTSSERCLRITEELLLAPTYDDISKRMMLIKEALFELFHHVTGTCNIFTKGIYHIDSYY